MAKCIKSQSVTPASYPIVEPVAMVALSMSAKAMVKENIPVLSVAIVIASIVVDLYGQYTHWWYI